MNQQEIFDTVVAHLRQQRCKAVDVDGNCRYRTEDGKKCAVGCLIQDDEYYEWMEGSQIGNLFVATRTISALKPLRERLFSEDNLPLLHALQKAHDQDYVYEWEADFQEIASQFGLQYTSDGTLDAIRSQC
jgi:hypothetical protein